MPKNPLPFNPSKHSKQSGLEENTAKLTDQQKSVLEVPGAHKLGHVRLQRASREASGLSPSRVPSPPSQRRMPAEPARGSLARRQQGNWACSEAGQVWVSSRQLVHYTRARSPGRRRRSAGGRGGGAASSSHDRHHQAEEEFVRRERPSSHLERLVSAFGKREYRIKEEKERRKGKK